MRTVGHREVRLVVAGGRLFAAEHHAGLRGLVADVARQHLVHADAAVKLGALGKWRSRQEIARHAGVNADAGRRLVEEALHEIDFCLHRRKRRERFTELHLCPGAAGGPVFLVDAIRHEQHGEALGRGGWHAGFRERFRAPHRDGLEPRQRHGDARTMEQSAAGNLEPLFSGAGGVAHGIS
jgi:hypothetical protein